MLPVLLSQLLFLWPHARRGEWDALWQVNSLAHSLTASDVASERPKAEPAGRVEPKTPTNRAGGLSLGDLRFQSEN